MSDSAIQKAISAAGMCDFSKKSDMVKQHISYMFMRTQSMFTWSGLPDTIQAEYLEQYIQILGYAGIVEHEGQLYALQGGLGGEPDAYYQPTLFTWASPYLKDSKESVIGEDCIIVKNDTFYIGLLPLFKKYASMLVENEISLNMAAINSRVQQILTAKDDRTKEACEKYIKDLWDGKLSALLDEGFEDDSIHGIPITTTSNTNILSDLIEYEQYIKASWYNELGLNANYNMKREALNSAESSINNDILFPLVDEMLRQRKAGAEKINQMFGTDISVELSSSWSDNKAEEEKAIEDIEDPGDVDEMPETDAEEETEDQEVITDE